MSIQVQVLGNYYLPIRLLDSTGMPVTGVTFNNVAATSYFNLGGIANMSPPDSTHWIEYGSGAYGLYVDNNVWLQVGAIIGGSFNSSDVIHGSISGANGTCAAGPLSVGPIPLLLSPVPGTFQTGDVLTDTTTPGATCTVTQPPSYMYIPNSPGPMVLIVTVSGANTFVGMYDVVTDLISTVVAQLTTVTQVLTGRYKIDATAKTLTFYAADNTTVLYQYNLKDAAGSPSTFPVYERYPF